MSALSRVIWSNRTLPRLSESQLGEQYIRQGGKGGDGEGRLQGGETGVSAKVQVHYLFCLTWPTDGNTIIIKKPAECYTTGHYLLYSSQQSCQNIILEICCFSGVRHVLFSIMHIML